MHAETEGGRAQLPLTWELVEGRFPVPRIQPALEVPGWLLWVRVNQPPGDQEHPFTGLRGGSAQMQVGETPASSAGGGGKVSSCP